LKKDKQKQAKKVQAEKQEQQQQQTNTNLPDISKLQLETKPNYRIFYRNFANNLEEIKDFVVKAQVPKVNTDKLQVSASFEGRILIDDKTSCTLDIQIPFALDTSKSIAQYFKENSELYLVVPARHTLIDKNEADKMVPISITTFQKVENSTEDFSVNVEQELTDNVEDIQSAPVSQQTPVPRFENNVEREESMYRNLYKQIREANEKKAAKAKTQVQEQVPLRNAPVKKTEKKVGRNDDCPCGSGKKYKKCHGQ